MNGVGSNIDGDGAIATDAVGVELLHGNCVRCAIELRLDIFGAECEIRCEMVHASDAFFVDETYSNAAFPGGRIKFTAPPSLPVFVLIGFGSILINVTSEPVLPVVA